MAYSSITKPSDYFNTVLYTGNGGTNNVTGVGFQPDWVWIKRRSSSQDHNLYDVIRGATKAVESNSTSAEQTKSDDLTAFASDGFTLGSGIKTNANSETHVAWNWLAANGTASNSDGSITTTVSANTTAGFSIVSYTGTGSAGTIGHGLGTTPAMGIFKNRSASSTHWRVWHQNLDNDKILELSDTTAAHTPGTADFNISNNSSTVWGLSTNSQSNGSGNSMIAYIFAEKKGYSKFGSYTGNGNADGTFVYTGFKPAFVLMKKTSGGQARNWCILDNKREGFNPENDQLHSNTTGAESMGSGTTLDLLSNGFKLRVTDDDKNGSGDPYIFMALAENPFVGNDSGTAVPVVAR